MMLGYHIRGRALYAVPDDAVEMAVYDFLVVFHRSCSSNMHSFRDNEVSLRTESDVIVICPLGSAEYSFQQRNYEGLIWFPISVQ